MRLTWFKRRRYRHFDLPVNEVFARRAMNPAFVSAHSFLPLMHYTKLEKRYRKCSKTGERLIINKKRPIKYASHRDACILSYYSHQINLKLERYYTETGISDCVISYRSLGQSNYNFASEAMAYAQKNSPSMILAFDISGFFDNLDHYLLKRRLRSLLGTRTLPNDWYKIFRYITRFYYVERDDLKVHPLFGTRLREKGIGRIASVEELKAEAISFRLNPELEKGFERGIPQGTPISATASNLYMMDFDVIIQRYCREIGAFYRRYSDDILVICNPSHANAIEAEILRLIAAEKLEISPHKTEKTLFDRDKEIPSTSKAAQYLGFTLHEGGPAIRESSLARQWRKMRRAIRRARRSAMWRAKAGLSSKIYTKKLYRRFSYLAVNNMGGIYNIRNFCSYGRRSAEAFGGKQKISRQIKRFEKAARNAIKELSISE